MLVLLDRETGEFNPVGRVFSGVSRGVSRQIGKQMIPGLNPRTRIRFQGSRLLAGPSMCDQLPQGGNGHAFSCPPFASRFRTRADSLQARLAVT